MKLRIEQDFDPQNPRKDYDHLAKMVCWHRRYALGDEQPKYPAGEFFWRLMAEDHPDIPDDIDLKHIERFVDKHYVCRNLYLYDHGDITISTSPFSCPWDSGQVGYIIAKKSDLIKAGVPEDKWYKMLDDEVEEYDQYLTGDVYGYIIEDDDGEEIESCWGFFGEQYCRDAGEEQLRYHERKAAELEPYQLYVDGL